LFDICCVAVGIHQNIDMNKIGLHYVVAKENKLIKVGIPKNN
jgi:hypothetical protein